jgi:hypothetical protein
MKEVIFEVSVLTDAWVAQFVKTTPAEGWGDG